MSILDPLPILTALQHAKDAASAVSALIDHLRAAGCDAALALLRPGFGNVEITQTKNALSDEAASWLAEPDAEWQTWDTPLLVLDETAAPFPAGTILVPVWGEECYGILCARGLTADEAALLCAVLAERLRFFEAERRWRYEQSAAGERESGLLDSLNDLVQALWSSHDESALWNTLDHHLNLFFETTSYYIGLFESGQDRLTLPLVSEDGLRIQREPIPLVGFGRAVITHGIELHIQDSAQEMPRLDALNITLDEREPGAWAHSWLGVPLRKGRGEIAGLIALQHTLPYSFDSDDLTLLMTIAGIVSAVLDAHRLRESERARRTAMSALMDIGQVVSSARDYHEALDTMLDQLQRVVRYDTASILMTAPNTPDAQQLLLYGINQPDHLGGAELTFAERDPVVQALQSGQPILLHDAQSSPDWDRSSPLPDARRIRALLAIPMIVESRALGVVVLGRFQPYAYSDADVSFGFALARQGALAVETARLRAQWQLNYRMQEERARRLDSIHRITAMITSSLDPAAVLRTAAQLTAELFEVDHCGIVMYDEDGVYGTLVAEYPETGNKGMRIPVGSLEYAGELRSGRLVLIENVEELTDPAAASALSQVGANAALFAPLIAQDKLIGTIGLDLMTSARVFTMEDRETLMTVAGQIAMAVHNAVLYAQAVDANRLKSEFLATVSHELRTPLNAIIGYTEMLLSSVYGELSEKQIDRLERVHRSGNHLLGMINNVLDLSKIEAGQTQASISPARTSEIIREAANAIFSAAQGKGLSLELDLPTLADEPLALLDTAHFRRMLDNLLDNAVKFTETGSVRISIRALETPAQGQNAPPISLRVPDGAWVAIAVEDTGIGIRPEDQAIIYEPLRQVDGSSVREYGGTGVGLALVKRLAELQGGFIWVASEVGKGSTFTLLFPQATDAAEAAGELPTVRAEQ